MIRSFRIPAAGLLCLALAATWLGTGYTPALPGGQPASPSLKDAYKAYFPIGVAVAPRNLTGPEADLIRQQFNSLTPENAMKMGPIHPAEDRYNWTDADAIVDFAQKNGMRVRGHNLCWHEQYPAWFFVDAAGKQVTKEVLLKRLKDHITTVVNRYKGRIYQWDVVNEAIDDNDQAFLRESSPFYQICGDEFIARAFQYAHEADPSAELFYNDYNTERPAKRARVYRLLKQLVDAKVPIHGVGLQAHWSVFEPTRAELETAIRQYASLGLKVQFTELDMSVYPWEKNRRARRPDDEDTYTPEREQQQLAQYKMVFDVFRQQRKVVSGVTFWNISDKTTWLDAYPVPGRKNYPLLFDTSLKPKKAYWSVVRF